METRKQPKQSQGEAARIRRCGDCRQPFELPRQLGRPPKRCKRCRVKRVFTAHS